MAAGVVKEEGAPPIARVQITLLGAFTTSLSARRVGRWYRPSAKRHCELLMLSPGLTLRREVAREALFANLSPAAGASALSTALSLSRDAVPALGEKGPGLLRSDRAPIWVAEEIPLEIDLVVHEGALRAGLSKTPGSERDLAQEPAMAPGPTQPAAPQAVRLLLAAPTPAPLARRSLCVVRRLDPVRSLPATSICMDQGGAGGGG
jgi:hypothetical protein